MPWSNGAKLAAGLGIAFGGVGALAYLSMAKASTPTQTITLCIGSASPCVTTDSLSADGGTVTIDGTVEGIADGTAITITGSDGKTQSATVSGGAFSVGVSFAANTGTTAESTTFQASAGGVTSNSVTITVAGASAPSEKITLAVSPSTGTTSTEFTFTATGGTSGHDAELVEADGHVLDTGTFDSSGTMTWTGTLSAATHTIHVEDTTSDVSSNTVSVKVTS